MEKQYTCDKCKYTCFFESLYMRHLRTRKHMRNKNDNNNNDKNDNDNENDNIRFSNNEIMVRLIKENKDMKKMMKEQHRFMKEQQEQQRTIIEMLPKLGGITNVKQKFNLNFFLNEQCKNAVPFCDFINSLDITFDDLKITREQNLEQSVSNIFLRGLKDLEVHKRPIHCTDIKRDTMYIRDDEKWEKDDGNVKLKQSLTSLSYKQLYALKDLKNSDPDIQTMPSKKEEFLLTMENICNSLSELGEKRIIKTISKNVHVIE